VRIAKGQNLRDVSNSPYQPSAHAPVGEWRDFLEEIRRLLLAINSRERGRSMKENDLRIAHIADFRVFRSSSVRN
jgi:hypothetical protein